MDNLLNFPSSTIVDKIVPKNAFWQKASNPATLKDLLTRDFDAITWLYKLTAQTLNVADGTEVEEIDVFLCQMKSGCYNAKPFCAIDKLLPRHTIYIIRFGESYDILMHHKAKTTARGETLWQCGPTETLTPDNSMARQVKIEGQTLDAVYYGLLAQVSGLPVSNQEEYEQKAEIRRQLRQIEKQIVTLQRAIRKERQFNRQVEMNSEARRLKRQAEELKTRLQTW